MCQKISQMVTSDEVVLYEKLPLDEPDVLNNLLSLTQILKKYDLLPQEIHYDGSLKPTLTYYGIQVSIGSDDYLSQKICASVGDRFHSLREMYGTLQYLDTWTPDTTDIVFDRDCENPQFVQKE